jgi:hypothetical protein
MLGNTRGIRPRTTNATRRNVFHDGQTVRAANPIASIARWAKRDSVCNMLLKLGIQLAAVDGRMFTVATRVPAPIVLEAFSAVSDSRIKFGRGLSEKGVLIEPSGQPVEHGLVIAMLFGVHDIWFREQLRGTVIRVSVPPRHPDDDRLLNRLRLVVRGDDAVDRVFGKARRFRADECTV